jgi:DNA-binding transcriptional MerR regulator
MNISAVSKKYNIPKDTLRYYEKIGLIPSVNRKESGIRNYNEIDIGWIEFIKCMRNAGLPIKALVEYVELFKKGNKTAKKRKQILVDQREELLNKMKEMENTLEIMNHKIKVYDTELRKKEKQLKKT